MFPSYRNQSVDLLCKSIDWFLYDENIGLQKVKVDLHLRPPVNYLALHYRAAGIITVVLIDLLIGY